MKLNYLDTSKVVAEIRRTIGLKKIKVLADKIMEEQYWKEYSIQDFPNEKWMPVIGYEQYYLVSNLGRIKSIKRYKCKNDRVLKQNICNGQCVVKLSINGVKRNEIVHLIVAGVFVKNKQRHTIIHHRDNIPLNNQAINLRRCTQSQNIKFSYNQGRPPVTWGKASGTSHGMYGRHLSYKSKNRCLIIKRQYRTSG